MNKIISVFSLVFLLLIPFISKGQIVYEDAIYLKSGSIIYGTIIDNAPGKYVTIKTDDGSILTNKWDQIYKISKVQNSKNRKNDTAIYGGAIEKSGYVNNTEFNIGPGIGNSVGNVLYGIKTINGYQFNPEVMAGAGIGYFRYKNMEFMPLFGNFTYDYHRKSILPLIWSIDVGYSAGLSKNNNGGYFFVIAIGDEFKLTQKVKFILGLSYNYQYYQYNGNYLFDYLQAGNLAFYETRNGFINTSISYLTLNVGVRF